MAAACGTEQDRCRAIVDACKSNADARAKFTEYWSACAFNTKARLEHLLTLRELVASVVQEAMTTSLKAKECDSVEWTMPLYVVTWCVSHDASISDQLGACTDWSAFWELIRACLDNAIKTTNESLQGTSASGVPGASHQQSPDPQGPVHAGVDPVSTQNASGHALRDGVMVYDNGGECKQLGMGQCPY